MDEINKLTGRDYKLFNYYGAPDAEVIVIMCSGAETVRHGGLSEQEGQGGGMVQVHLYRPSPSAFCGCDPRHLQEDRRAGPDEESGSVGEPLYLDVQSALQQAGRVSWWWAVGTA